MLHLSRIAVIGLLLGLALPGLAAPAALNQGVPTTSLDILLPGAEFAPGLPTLQDVTGVAPTERPLRPDEVLAWFKALAEASPRAQLVEFARTYEGRPLVYLAVSDEATIADLDGFKARHAALLDPRTGAEPGARDKPVAWMAYGIHGDELSSTDAAALLAWWLVAGEDTAGPGPARRAAGADRSLRESRRAHPLPGPDHVLRPPHRQPRPGRPLPPRRVALGPGQPLPVRHEPRLVHHGAAGEPALGGDRRLAAAVDGRQPRDGRQLHLPVPAGPPSLQPAAAGEHRQVGARVLGRPGRAPWTGAAIPTSRANGTRSSSRATARRGPRTWARWASSTRCPAPAASWCASRAAPCAPSARRSSTS